MASGFGVDPTKDSNGNITSGTTSQDIQNIFGGLYSPGLVSGGVVNTSSSAMTYSVGSGVAIVPVAAGQNIAVPIPSTSVTVSAGPVSGNRTDIVYVQQRMPAIEGDSQVVVNVAQGTALPPRAVALNTYTVPAGATNTSVCTQTGSVNYAIPYSGGLGVLYKYQYTTSGNLPTALTRIGAGTFYLPTARMVRFSMSAVLYAVGANGFDNSKYCEMVFYPNIDNTDQLIWNSPGLHQAWANYTWTTDIQLSAGTHTCNLGMLRSSGGGQPATVYGSGSGVQRAGINFRIEDAGAVQ